MIIRIKRNPKNKTNFNRGDILTYKGCSNRFMVVGEDNMYLHTFILGSGQYWGVFKIPANLSCLIKVASASVSDGVTMETDHD